MAARILCPVDLAHEKSWQIALPEAAREARLRDAELHLLCVVPDLGMSMVAQYFPEGHEREMLERAEADLARIAQETLPAGTAHQCHVAHGHPAEEILAAAERLGATLIVMASHKPDSLRTLFVSSMADRIVHHAPQSVLIVRGN
ncbi:universal stress protein UspF [Paralimibaculum aggregatum]|uniref:Universal stress protein UspF n=1 Tax=Paralimibaculum aggregatum TaxID=3036245 RepID=A0ABQ6LCA7_9RHOB|nr:universal stress protein [Limibaculum sp. NKW23]GMG81018.1 universal stress protein UspF [Limibaculum sp. NKW23]